VKEVAPPKGVEKDTMEKRRKEKRRGEERRREASTILRVLLALAAF